MAPPKSFKAHTHTHSHTAHPVAHCDPPQERNKQKDTDPSFGNRKLDNAIPFGHAQHICGQARDAGTAEPSRSDSFSQLNRNLTLGDLEKDHRLEPQLIHGGLRDLRDTRSNASSHARNCFDYRKYSFTTFQATFPNPNNGLKHII